MFASAVLFSQFVCKVVGRLMAALDVWEPALGFRIINENWGAPVGSKLLWPHLETRFLV